jgi:hypothetical protein
VLGDPPNRVGKLVPADLTRARQLFLKACHSKDELARKDYALMLV